MMKIILFSVVFLLVFSFSQAKIVVPVETLGGKGTEQGKFGKEIYLAFDQNNQLYLVDTKHQRLQIFPPGKDKPTKVIKLEAFTEPKKIALDGKNNIYLTDWKYEKIIEGENIIYNYGVCVHQLNEKGELVRTVTLRDLKQPPRDISPAKPFFDKEGRFVLVLENDYQREIFIAAFGEENLYIFDQGKLYLFTAGKKIKEISFPYQKINSLVADQEGNLYCSLPEAHFITKINGEGEIILTFGQRGLKKGEFYAPFHLTFWPPHQVVVADEAEFYQEHISYLKPRKNDPIFKDEEEKKYQILLKRVQIFDLNGKYQQKILYQIDLAKVKKENFVFKGIDSAGNIFLLDKEHSSLKKYITRVLPLKKKIKEKWLGSKKSFRLSYSHRTGEVGIDNWYDLDEEEDFWEKDFSFERIGLSFKNSYFISEGLTLTGEERLVFAHIRYFSYSYPDEEFYWSLVQDDFTREEAFGSRTSLKIEMKLDQDVYRARKMSLEGFFTWQKIVYVNFAIHPENERYLTFQLWRFVGGGEVIYDLKKDFSLFLNSTWYFPARFWNYRYSYIDESGDLVARGWRKAKTTQVTLGMKAVF